MSDSSIKAVYAFYGLWLDIVRELLVMLSWGVYILYMDIIHMFTRK